MNKALLAAILLSVSVTASAQGILGTTYKIADTFDGCEYDKYYPLTNGMYLRCDQYKYFYKYRPDVVADGNKVYEIDGREVRGTIVQGRTISTQIDGEWEGCNFDTHRLTNGMYLVCNSYFYEYAYGPSVEILVIGGSVKSVTINGDSKDGVSVYSQ